MRKIKESWGLILYLLIIVALTAVLFWAIGRKEGFHEDEMFSYGASNSTLGNTFLSYGRVDNIDSIIKTRNPFLTLENYVYYKVVNKDAYNQAVKDLNRDDFKSIWRTKSDAIEYLQIDNFEEAIDFASVYWNTAKDVNPPLFKMTFVRYLSCIPSTVILLLKDTVSSCFISVNIFIFCSYVSPGFSNCSLYISTF